MIQLKLGPNTFTVVAMNPRRSFPLQAKIWPVVVEIAVLFAKLTASAGKVEESVEQIAEADIPKKRAEIIRRLFEKDVLEIIPLVSNVFSSLPYDDLAFIQKELLSETLVDGGRLFAGKGGGVDLFDTVMVARTVDTWKLMWFATKETFPDFRDLLPGSIAGGGEGAASAG